jgi:hypothetical protein
MLHDYANGQWKKLHVWNTQEGANEALAVIDQMLGRQRDDIYIACIRFSGCERGYLVVHDSNFSMWTRAFWQGIYEPDEAFKDVANRCRKIADKMGYRRPDDTVGVTFSLRGENK